MSFSCVFCCRTSYIITLDSILYQASTVALASQLWALGQSQSLAVQSDLSMLIAGQASTQSQLEAVISGQAVMSTRVSQVVSSIAAAVGGLPAAGTGSPGAYTTSLSTSCGVGCSLPAYMLFSKTNVDGTYSCTLHTMDQIRHGRAA